MTDLYVFKTWQISQSDPISVVRLIFVCLYWPIKVTPAAEVRLVRSLKNKIKYFQPSKLRKIFTWWARMVSCSIEHVFKKIAFLQREYSNLQETVKTYQSHPVWPVRSDTHIRCRDHLWPLPGPLIININFTQSMLCTLLPVLYLSVTSHAILQNGRPMSIAGGRQEWLG